MCKYGINAHQVKCLSFDAASGFPARDLSGVLKPLPAIKPVGEIVSKRFLCDEAAIESLKKKIKASDPSIDFRPSKVEMVSAFIWRGVIRAARARHGQLRASLTTLSINLRGRTAMQVPNDSFGNHFLTVPIKFIPDETKMELHHFVQLIRTRLEKAQRDCAKASADELFSMNVKLQNEIIEERGNDELDIRMCTSLCRLPLYAADFGWGKPCWICSGHGNAALQAFKLLDTRCGTGIEVLLHLNDIEMAIFECDSDVAATITSSAN